MTNPITRWLRSGRASDRKGTPESLEAELAALEREHRTAPPGLRAQSVNRAGDLCNRAGHLDRALAYYGRAIDAFLEDQQPEPARAVAQKVIRLHAGAVRTVCTLTWLDLAAGHTADAIGHLEDYVEAAERAGREELAAKHVLEMARIVADADFRSAAGEALLRLDDAAAANEVFGWALEGSSDERMDPDELEARCTAAALDSSRPPGAGPAEEREL